MRRRRHAAALEKAAAAALGAAAALETAGERDGSASASGCTGGATPACGVCTFLCALLLVLNHAILNNESTRGRRGTVGSHVRWFVISSKFHYSPNSIIL
jgi:hypothetical protein